MRYHSSSVEELPGPSRGPGPRRSCSWAEMNGDVSVPVSSTSSGSNAGYNRKTWSGGHTTRRNGDFHSASNIPVQHLYPIVKLIKQEPVVKTEPADAADGGQNNQAYHNEGHRPSHCQGPEEEFQIQRFGSRNIPGSSTYSTVAHQQQHKQRVLLPNPMYDLRKRLIAASSSGAGGSSSYSSDETLPNHINPSAPVSVPAPVSPTPSVEYIGTNLNLNQQETQETMFYINVDRNGYHNSHSQLPDVETEPPTPSTSTETILSIKQELEDIHCVKMTKQSQVVNNRRVQRQRTGHGQMERYETQMQSAPQSRQQDLWYRENKDYTDSFYCKHCDESFPFFNRLLRHLRKHDEHNNTINQSPAPIPPPSARSRSSTTHLQQHQTDLDDTPIILKDIRVVIPKAKMFDGLATMFYRERNQDRTLPVMPRPVKANPTFPKLMYDITAPVVRNRRGTASKNSKSLENISRMVCLYCDKGFQSPEELKRHEMAHLKNVPSVESTSEVPSLPSTTTPTDNFPCKVCGKVCTHPWNLKQHMKKHTNNNNKRKRFNSRGTASKSLENISRLVKQDMVPLSCNKGFQCTKELKYHPQVKVSSPDPSTDIRRRLRERPPKFRSDPCQKDFNSSPSQLKIHDKKFHTVSSPSSISNISSSSRKPKRGLPLKTEENECDYCGRKYKYPSQLINHSETCRSKKRARALTTTTTSDYENECDYCGRKYKYPSVLINHSKKCRIKKRGRPLTTSDYECDYCGKKYKYPSVLIIHSKTCRSKKRMGLIISPKTDTPGGGAPFNCEHCGREFKYLAHLKIHRAQFHAGLNSKTQGRPLKSTEIECKYCGKEYKYPSHLVIHNKKCRIKKKTEKEGSH